MTQQNTDNKHDLVEKFILDDFIDDFMNHYAMALFEGDKHPEQANNEVRNAFVHIGRILANDNQEKNLIKAKDHIERAKRDCLKISIIEKYNKLNQCVKNIESVKNIPLPIQRKQLRIVFKDRVVVFMHETKGKSITGELLGIYSKLRDVEDDLFKDYGELNQYNKKAPVYRFFRKLFKIVRNIFAGVLLTIISAYILAIMFPDGEVGNNTKIFLEEVLLFINKK